MLLKSVNFVFLSQTRSSSRVGILSQAGSSQATLAVLQCTGTRSYVSSVPTQAPSISPASSPAPVLCDTWSGWLAGSTGFPQRWIQTPALHGSSLQHNPHTAQSFDPRTWAH